VAEARDAVVETVGERPRDETEGRSHSQPRPPGQAQAPEDSPGPHLQAAVRCPEDEAVRERTPLSLGDERAEGLAAERGEAQHALPVDGQQEADRQVAEAAGPVVEEDGQGSSARSAATRASMLATEVSPSRRKRTTAEPSSASFRASRISLVGKAASSNGSTSASPQ